MIDCGEDWLGRLRRVRPDAVIVTHAHPDHAGGLARGAPCPIYATAVAWRALGRFDVPQAARRIVRPREPVRIAGFLFEAFPLVHSLRAPAVGYRITGDGAVVFYAPDVLSIPARRAALRGIRVYVGDGASIVRPIVRRRGRVPFGHAAIATQLDWCRAERVRRAIFTHCGTAIVAGDAREVAARVEALGRARGVRTTIAHDGLVLTPRRRSRSIGSPHQSTGAPATAGACRPVARDSRG